MEAIAALSTKPNCVRFSVSLPRRGSGTLEVDATQLVIPSPAHGSLLLFQSFGPGTGFEYHRIVATSLPAWQVGFDFMDAIFFFSDMRCTPTCVKLVLPGGNWDRLSSVHNKMEHHGSSRSTGLHYVQSTVTESGCRRTSRHWLNGMVAVGPELLIISRLVQKVARERKHRSCLPATPIIHSAKVMQSQRLKICPETLPNNQIPAVLYVQPSWR